MLKTHFTGQNFGLIFLPDEDLHDLFVDKQVICQYIYKYNTQRGERVREVWRGSERLN